MNNREQQGRGPRGNGDAVYKQELQHLYRHHVIWALLRGEEARRNINKTLAPGALLCWKREARIRDIGCDFNVDSHTEEREVVWW